MRLLLWEKCISSVYLLALALGGKQANGCTNVLVTPGASEDGSAMLAYNTDDNELFGMMFHFPASTNNTSNRKVYEWESGKYFGSIPEASETHNVIGNCNDRGLCIGETSFGGIPLVREFHPDSIIDYGSLIWITLQRSESAHGAIRTMASLLKTYGYASYGESYSIVDANEAWIMDVVSKGKHQLGAVWVARRIPDGMVSAHANRARITTFPQDEPDNCLFAEDVVDFARDQGLYDGKDANFDFSGTYDKKPPGKLRYAATRILDIFSALTQDEKFAAKHLNYALELDPNNPIPLWIKPKKKVSLNDLRERMASHYEGTALDYRNEVGSGLFGTPYRPRPYQWELGNKLYVNERNIGVEKTGINFIAQIRGWMPKPLSAVIWFGADDASTAPRFPAYTSSTRVSAAFRGLATHQGHVRPIMDFDMGKAFWVQNMVSNFVYARWRDAYPVLKSKLDQVHKGFVEEVVRMDEEALHLYRTKGADAAIARVTEFSVDTADRLHEQWTEFYGYLFVRFRDFVTIEPDPSNLACGCKTTEIGMTYDWRKRIVEATGSHFEVPTDNATGAQVHAEGSEGRGGAVAWSVAILLAALVGVLFLVINKHEFVVSKLRRGRYNDLERMISLEEAQM